MQMIRFAAALILGVSLALTGCGGDKNPAERQAAVKQADHPAGGGVDVAAVTKLMQDKTCFTCHTTDGGDTINGVKAIGPTLKGLFGRSEAVLTNGVERMIVVDDAYLMKSMKEPMADITKDYAPAMVVPPLTDEEIRTIVEYIKTLK